MKTFLIALIISAAGASSCFAADSFPFEVEFDVDQAGRLCYAGHQGSTVRYKEGMAVTPDTCFSLIQESGDVAGNALDGLSAEVSLIYENEAKDGSYTETLKVYERGSLSEDEKFEILSENNIANLKERGKLYSDSLKGMMLTLSLNYAGTDREKTIYLYVCDDEDLYYFCDNDEAAS